MSTYRCPDCGYEEEWSSFERGTPVCPDCACDMDAEDTVPYGWTKIGSFGVDSGQVLITDPCYLDSWKGHDFDEEAIKKMQKDRKFEYSYSGACARTLLDRSKTQQGAGELNNGFGVVSGTGYGDGEYPVYAMFNREGRIMQLMIDFN